MSDDSSTAPLLETCNLTVEFDAQRALDGVSFRLMAGEIVGLVGVNGAGKSTLGRVLVGEIPFGSFGGEFRLRSKEARFSNAKMAHAGGVALIHQDGAAIGELTIGENVMLTIEPGHHALIDWRALHDRAASGLRQLGVVVDTRLLLGKRGGVALTEFVEIARSIVRGCSVIVFDESTAALGGGEVRTLLSRMRELADSGAGVIFISHRIDEVLAICDRVVVLRDGRKVLDRPRSGNTHTAVIEAMLGTRGHTHSRGPEAAARLRKEYGTEPVYAIRNWQVPISDFSRINVGPLNFDVHRGEILGVFGPLGAGKTELLQSLYGLYDGTSDSECRLNGRWVRPFTAADTAIRHGMALVPAERRREGVVPGLSVLENMMLGYRRSDLSRRGTIRHADAQRLCERFIREFGIATSGPDQRIDSLSGGNQQKVLLARALVNSPQILLLDEPTRGIDIRAKEDVYRLMREASAAGCAIIVSSLEEGELIGLADRILVLRDGRQVALLDGRATDEHELLSLTVGGKAD